MENEHKGIGLWAGLALGLGIAAFTGVVGVLLYLAFRRSPGAPTQLNGFQGPYPMSLPTGRPAPLRATVYPLSNAIARTVSLGTEASALYYADRDVEMTVSTVGPPGTFGFYGIDSDLSDDTSGIFIPAGDWRLIKMRTGQRLYGRGTVDGVRVSLNGG